MGGISINVVELLIFLFSISLLIIPIVAMIDNFDVLIEGLEMNSILMDMNVFRKTSVVTDRRSAFLVYHEKYRYDDYDGMKRKELEFLKISSWTNGGRYYMNKDGFPERVGTFVIEGKRRKWRVSLTPVVGKINLYELK